MDNFEETQNEQRNESDSHHEEHLENTNSFQRIDTQGRERGKWVVNVVDSDGLITEERLNAPDKWGMENRKFVLEFGPNNQPEGGSGGLFGTCLGQLSNDLNKFPITYVDSRKVQSWRKDDGWNYIQTKFHFDAANVKHPTTTTTDEAEVTTLRNQVNDLKDEVGKLYDIINRLTSAEGNSRRE